METGSRIRTFQSLKASVKNFMCYLLASTLPLSCSRNGILKKIEAYNKWKSVNPHVKQAKSDDITHNVPPTHPSMKHSQPQQQLVTGVSSNFIFYSDGFYIMIYL